MRNIWIAIASGMIVLMTGLGAWEAQAVSSSSLAGLGNLSSKIAPFRKPLVWVLVAAAWDSIAFATAGAAGVGPACKIRKRVHSRF